MPKREGEKRQLYNFVLAWVVGLIWQCLMGKGLCSSNTDEPLGLEMQLMEECGLAQVQYPILTEKSEVGMAPCVFRDIGNLSNSSPECAMLEGMHPLDGQSGQYSPQGSHRERGLQTGMDLGAWCADTQLCKGGQHLSPLQRLGALSS